MKVSRQITKQKRTQATQLARPAQKTFAFLSYLLFLSLTLPTLPTAHATPSDMRGSTFSVMFRIYDALDALNTLEPNRFAQAISSLALARDASRFPQTKNRIEKAMTSLSDRRNRANRNFPSSAAVEMAKAALREALQTNRVYLGQSSPLEPHILERLIVTHLFPAHASQVKVNFDGIDRDAALIIILTYLTDPRRSIRYDPDVAILVAGRYLDSGYYGGGLGSGGGGDWDPGSGWTGSSGSGGGFKSSGTSPSADDPNKIFGDSWGTGSPKVSFLLPQQTYEVPESAEFSADELGRELQKTTTDLIKTTGVPLRAKVKAKGNKFTLTLEVLGMNGIPYVENYLRNFLALGQGNRYLLKIADLLSGGSTYLRTMHVGGQEIVKAFIARGADGLDAMEGAIRSKLIAGRWLNPTPDIIKLKIDQAANLNTEKLTNQMNQIVESLKNAGADEATIAAKQAEYSDKIAKIQSGAVERIAAVDEALKKLESSPQFQKLSEARKIEERLRVAEKAGKRWEITFDKALKVVTVAVASYYVYQWARDFARIKDPTVRLDISQYYGIKVVNNLMYAVPVIGEAAAAVDIWGWVLENTVLKAAGTNYDIPNVEDILHGLYRGVENIAYWSQGTSRFKVQLSEATDALQIPAALFRDQNGTWTSHQVNDVLQALKDESNDLPSEPTTKTTPAKKSQTKAKPPEPQGKASSNDEFGDLGTADAKSANKDDQTEPLSPSAQARVDKAKALRSFVKQLARQYAVLLFWLNDMTGSTYVQELTDYQEMLVKQLYDPQKGYFVNAQAVLGASLPKEDETLSNDSGGGFGYDPFR